MKRKREKQIEWWTNHEKKNREKLDKQIIEEVIDKLISTTVDMSEKEVVQKVENVPPCTGLGEPLQNSGMQKVKQKVSPGILKFKRMFEKEELVETKEEPEKYSRVGELRGAFEVMMEKSKTMYRVEEMREKKKTERKIKRDEKVRMNRVESRVETRIEQLVNQKVMSTEK